MEATTIEKALGNVEHILDLLFIIWRQDSITEKDKIYTATYTIDSPIKDKTAFREMLQDIKMKYFDVGKIYFKDFKLIVNIAQTQTIPAWLS